MPGAQERVLRRRIGSIQNTKKITAAMKMVAAMRNQFGGHAVKVDPTPSA